MKGADRGSSRGPWTVHVNFSADGGSEKFLEPAATAERDSSSRYAEPEAEGVNPVLRTGEKVPFQHRTVDVAKFYRYLHIFLISFGGRVRVRLVSRLSAFGRANTGTSVPLAGPLTRRLSVMVVKKRTLLHALLAKISILRSMSERTCDTPLAYGYTSGGLPYGSGFTSDLPTLALLSPQPSSKPPLWQRACL